MKISSYISLQGCRIRLDHEIFRPFYEIIGKKYEFFNHITNLLRPKSKNNAQKDEIFRKQLNYTTRWLLHIHPPMALEQLNSTNTYINSMIS